MLYLDYGLRFLLSALCSPPIARIQVTLDLILVFRIRLGLPPIQLIFQNLPSTSLQPRSRELKSWELKSRNAGLMWSLFLIGYLYFDGL
jgi:hypothetical protein